MINDFAEVTLSPNSDGNWDLLAEEVIITTTLSAIHVDPHSSEEVIIAEAEWIQSDKKKFVGSRPARCFIGCQSLILIPCAPCCIHVPAVRVGIGCVQFASRACVLVPVATLLFVLLCPFVYVSIIYDCFHVENKCVPDSIRPEQVLLSYLLCAPYNTDILEDKCWPAVHKEEREYFVETVSPDLISYFY